jgi:hypothetical protein
MVMRKPPRLSCLFPLLLAGCMPTPPTEPIQLPPTTVAAIDYRSMRTTRMTGTRFTPPAYTQTTRIDHPVDPTMPTQPTDPTGPAAPSLGMLDWRVDFDAHITTSPALFLPAWPTADDENDRVWAVVHTGGGWMLRAYYHIYKPANAPPDICFDTPIAADTDNGAISLSFDGQTAYLATSDGTLYGVANRATCDGQTYAATWAVGLGAGVAHTSPWLDTNNVLYVADLSGRLHAIDATTHIEAAGFPATISSSALRSTPVVALGKVWIGDAAGQLLVINSATGAVDVSVNLCRGTCGAADAIYSSVFVDLASGLVTVGVNGRMISVPSTC